MLNLECEPAQKGISR